jgi:hypothetical protein
MNSATGVNWQKEVDLVRFGGFGGFGGFNQLSVDT